ncbi:amidohydrolase [Rhodococcus fascians]|nr:amidohydrolase [Rhodococcus fascians]MBY4140907.1 amidohydrolase [Rhodococcus fascians]MBY4219571.1 amidohydrolase [Rhodococcus fascians]MBY4221880.1 amidohydrolase [Rhodococcus fascians]MBY4233881.1 amidohydrolase [Rhodococcus fascians]
MADATLMLINGKILTQVDDSPTAQAVAVHGDRVLAVGATEDIMELRSSETTVIDLAGGTLTPGWVDAHTHVVQGALMSLGVDFNRCETLDDVRQTLRDAVPVEGWIRGWGLNHNVFGGRAPNFAAIAESGTIPVLIRMYDAHSSLANQAALDLAGVTGRESFAHGVARVAVDDEGKPTGHLLEEAAIHLVEGVAPEHNPDSAKSLLQGVTEEMASVGLTGCHVMDDLPGTVDMIRALDQDDAGLRFWVYGWVQPDHPEGRIDELAELVHGTAGARWRYAGAKLFMDGTIEGGTAWLCHPDLYGDSTLPSWTDPERYADVIRKLSARGVSTATHAIGDAAVHHTVRTLAALKDGVRHRLEHLETACSEDLAAIAKATDLATSMQPTHCTRYTRADEADDWSQRMGRDRIDRAWPVAELLDLGVTVALGSDWPVADFDPRIVMADARLRRPADRPDDAPRQPRQAISARQALDGYTTHPASAAGLTDGTGSIVVGGPADFTAVDGDLWGPADTLPELPIIATVVGGTVVYQR